jgi:hypothetical protein
MHRAAVLQSFLHALPRGYTAIDRGSPEYQPAKTTNTEKRLEKGKEAEDSPDPPKARGGGRARFHRLCWGSPRRLVGIPAVIVAALGSEHVGAALATARVSARNTGLNQKEVLG